MDPGPWILDPGENTFAGNVTIKTSSYSFQHSFNHLALAPTSYNHPPTMGGRMDLSGHHPRRKSGPRMQRHSTQLAGANGRCGVVRCGARVAAA